MQCLSVTVKIRSSYGKQNSLCLLNCCLWNIVFNFSWIKGNGKKILIQENVFFFLLLFDICRCWVMKKARCLSEQQSSVRYLQFKCVLQFTCFKRSCLKYGQQFHDETISIRTLCKESEAFYESLNRQKNNFLQQLSFGG